MFILELHAAELSCLAGPFHESENPGLEVGPRGKTARHTEGRTGLRGTPKGGGGKTRRTQGGTGRARAAELRGTLILFIIALAERHFCNK